MVCALTFGPPQVKNTDCKAPLVCGNAPLAHSGIPLVLRGKAPPQWGAVFAFRLFFAFRLHAQMVELADTLDSGSSEKSWGFKSPSGQLVLLKSINRIVTFRKSELRFLPP